jgi:sulfatase modifying factor 1
MRRLFPLCALLSLTGCAAPSATTSGEKAEGNNVSNSTPKPPGPAPEGMVWVPGGSFNMGAEPDVPDTPDTRDQRPRHRVGVAGFWMDKYEVTNAQFAEFVEATGYVTEAEKPTVPGIPAGSLVFTPPAGPVELNDVRRWWRFVEGASWRHPEGPGSDIKERMNHPVVQVCWNDAAAYAKWAGKRLPTEAEWEFAARGGMAEKEFTWGTEFRPGGKIMANTWQGEFPHKNTKEDGFERTAPVGSFPPNGYGLFDMAGNVWEWCADWYRPDYYLISPERNPFGPDESYDPNEPGTPKRVQRGGSFLCNDQYCRRFRPAGRGKGDPLSAASHIGFRCVMDPK